MEPLSFDIFLVSPATTASTDLLSLGLCLSCYSTLILFSGRQVQKAFVVQFLSRWKTTQFLCTRAVPAMTRTMKMTVMVTDEDGASVIGYLSCLSCRQHCF